MWAVLLSLHFFCCAIFNLLRHLRRQIIPLLDGTSDTFVESEHRYFWLSLFPSEWCKEYAKYYFTFAPPYKQKGINY